MIFAGLTHVVCGHMANHLGTDRPQVTVASGFQLGHLGHPPCGLLSRLAGVVSRGSWIPTELKEELEMLPEACTVSPLPHSIGQSKSQERLQK